MTKRDPVPILAARARFRVVEGSCEEPDGLVGVGAPGVDARLEGGLRRAALHEMFATTPGDASAAAGFALLLAVRARAMRGATDKPLVWVREDRGEREAGRLHAPGFVELGCDPETVVLVTVGDTLSGLRAGADIVNCGAVGAVIIEPWSRAPVFDLTASRRLALAAARSGVMALVVRVAADPAPGAAQTRWRVGAAPSRALAANAPGSPAFDISLLRHRGGIAGFDARVEWNRDRQAFSDAPLFGGVPAVAAVRAGR